MALRFLQVNVNHCTAAQDILMQHLVECSIDVAVISEPYVIPADRENWVSDDKGLVALIISGATKLEKRAQGEGWVAAECGEFLLVGVYFAPSRTAVDF